MSRFTGWVRVPGQRWRAAVADDDEDTTWHLLRQHVEAHRAQFLDTYVGPADVDPPGGRRAGQHRATTRNAKKVTTETKSTHTLTIEDWHPSRVNSWDGRHWAIRARLKKADREIVGLQARLAGVPRATGKRRVSLVLTLGPRQRGGDPDAYWKSSLDALVHARMLVDDNRQFVELGSVSFQRGQVKATEISLADLEPVKPGIFSDSSNPDTSAPASPVSPKDFVG